MFALPLDRWPASLVFLGNFLNEIFSLFRWMDIFSIAITYVKDYMYSISVLSSNLYELN